jgi:hypothetical protein
VGCSRWTCGHGATSLEVKARRSPGRKNGSNPPEPRTQRQRSKRSLEKCDACRPAGRDSTAWWDIPFPELACGCALGYCMAPSGLGEIRDSRPS